MKKTGFTLAEVLVVLGIVGVVAALTLPSLMADTAAAQIGPKLAKAVTMFEQANAGVLNDALADNLLETGYLEDGYADKLTNHLKASTGGRIDHVPSTGTYTELDAVTAKDGTVYKACYDSSAEPNSGAAHKQKIGLVVIDIDGDTGANTVGTDIFAFTWWGDGSLRPYGGTGSDSGLDWKEKCKVDSVPGDAWACAGHIFENNLKVLYK